VDGDITLNEIKSFALFVGQIHGGVSECSQNVLMRDCKPARGKSKGGRRDDCVCVVIASVGAASAANVEVGARIVRG
jgi:hypothetical protein